MWHPKRTGDYFGLPETMNNVPRYLIRHMAAGKQDCFSKMCREARGAKRATVELQEKKMDAGAELPCPQFKRNLLSSRKRSPCFRKHQMCVTSVIDEYNGLYRCAESTATM